MRVITGSSSTLPCAIGDHASVAMPLLPVEGADVVVAEVRVHLDLVHRGHGVGLLGQSLEVGDLEVGHPDAAWRARRP